MPILPQVLNDKLSGLAQPAPNRILAVLFAVLVAQPFLALVREALRIPAAAFARALSTSQIVEPALELFRLSRIQIEMMVKALGSTRPEGIALAGMPGDLLHSVFPSFFLEPKSVACGAIVSTVIQRGGAITGFVFTGTLIDSVLLAVGTLLVKFGSKRSPEIFAKNGRLRNILLLWLGLVIQVEAAWAILSAFQRPKLVQDLGGDFLVGLVSKVGSHEYAWILHEFLPSAIPISIIAVVVTCTLLLYRVASRIRRELSRDIQPRMPNNMSWRNVGVSLSAQIAIVLIAQWFPPYFGMAKTSMLGTAASSSLCSRAARDYYSAPSTTIASRATPAATPAHPVAISSPTSIPTPTQTPTPQPTAVRFPQVRLGRDGDRFKFLLDNKPTKLLGINYNVDYDRFPASRQAARYTQDFQLLASHGFLVVTGWGVFNETTLDSAEKYGIRVIMPIELDPTKVYGNPSFRDKAIQKLLHTVARFQDSPALIMWNPGGDEFLTHVEEDLHTRSVSEEQRKIVLQEASNLLVEMARLAYLNDKHHRPSVIKQVQDWHVENLAQSLEQVRRSGDDPSIYIVYGADVYGWPDYIAPILERVEAAVRRLGLAWFVAEFGPVGTGQVNRANGYVDAFQLIRRTSSMGAAVYVFAPDLPDPVLAAPLSLLEIHDDPVDDSKRQLTPVDSTLQDLGSEFIRAQLE
jgi:hypothetical protein